MKQTFFLRTSLAALALSFSLMSAQAHGGASSDLSALSVLPVAVSITGSALLLSGAATLSIAAVEVTAEGTSWVIERASDGARFSVRLGAAAAGGVSVVAGTAVVVSAIGAGWVLSTAGQAIAFVPNEIGKALLYNERVTR